MRKRSTGISGAVTPRARRTRTTPAATAAAMPTTAGRAGPPRVRVSTPMKRSPSMAALSKALVQSNGRRARSELRQEAQRQPEVEDAERHVDGEEPRPRPDREDAGGQRRRDRRRDRDDEAVQPDAAAEVGVRIGIADERAVHAHQRGAADPLEDTGGDQEFEAPRQRAEQRAEGEERDAELVDPPVADTLAHRGERQQQRDDDELVGVDHPDRLRRRRAELAGDARQRDVDDGAVEHRHGDADGDGEHCEVAARRRQAVGVDHVGHGRPFSCRDDAARRGEVKGRTPRCAGG